MLCVASEVKLLVEGSSNLKPDRSHCSISMTHRTLTYICK